MDYDPSDFGCIDEHCPDEIDDLDGINRIMAEEDFENALKDDIIDDSLLENDIPL